MFTPQTLWSLLAAFVAVGLEYSYRTLPAPWLSTVPHMVAFVALQCVIGASIYKIVTVPGVPLVGALVVWSFATIFTRVFVSAVVLHDRISPGTWLALALMVLARIAQNYWR